MANVDIRGQSGLDGLTRGLDAIRHRGPDDSGLWQDRQVVLGFRRLSIQDLSSLGHQPMSSPDGACTIVFNGEIYNFIELRRELESLGHVFRSHGDTEVLLAAYRQWGTDCLRRLSGMWAFVLFDRARGVIFGSRDRFGIKPLFRYRHAGGVMLASEIKAIRASGLYRDELDLTTCARFFYDGQLDHEVRTFFAGIEQLPAAHAFELSLDGHYREWRYWQIEPGQQLDPQASPPELFAQAWDEAMRLHMRSDVPVGVNLSGGLDSTAILCAASRLNAEAGSGAPLMAFCYQDARFDESSYIHDTLAQTGARMVPLQLTPQALWRSLPAVLAAQDEPVHSMTALIGYHLMALAARNGVKVVLNGQGADEVIGGYGSYFGERWAELVRAGSWLSAWREIVAFTAAHGGDARSRFLRACRHVAQSALGGAAGYRALADWQYRRRADRSTWLAPSLGSHLTPPWRRNDVGLFPTLRDSVARDPLPLYLRIEDRNSMAHSVEARVPFLDHRLVEQVFAMGPEWKLRGPWNKYVLRQAMTGRIPESVRTRVDKMGFPTDMATWLRGPLHDEFEQILHDPDFVRHPSFRAQALQADLKAHREGLANHAERLFAAAHFFLWERGLRSGATRAATPAAQAAVV